MKKITIILVAMFLLSVLLYIFLLFIEYYDIDFIRDIVLFLTGSNLNTVGLLLIFSSAIVTIGVMGSFLTVKSKTRVLNHKDKSSSKEVHDINLKIRRLEKQASLLSNNKRNELLTSIKDELYKTATNEFIQDIEKNIEENKSKLDVSQRGKETLSRIYAEIEALSRRATVNLILGVITALSGILFLSFFVFAKKTINPTLLYFTLEFLPRLSIVLIIEVFSYFFLRLYKSSLTEIRYYQNEATNIEYMFIALESSINRDDEKLIDRCINKFLEVERNPVFSKNQITHELLSSRETFKDMPLTSDYLGGIKAVIKDGKVS